MPKLNKGTLETVKTVLIAVLITGIVAFVAGTRYQASQDTRVTAQVAAQAATTGGDSKK
jgi:type II secretory pathway pseudopilin PulG